MSEFMLLTLVPAANAHEVHYRVFETILIALMCLLTKDTHELIDQIR